jgi:hypothetical protein
MKTKENWLQLANEKAIQRHADLERQDELEQYDNYETTIERLEARGFIDGLQEGIMAGFDYAIHLLQNEGFIEHAHILRSQRAGIESSLNVGNE